MSRFSLFTTPEEDGFNDFKKYFSYIKCIGAGSFGKVFLAKDLETNEEYAVKVDILKIIC